LILNVRQTSSQSGDERASGETYRYGVSFFFVSAQSGFFPLFAFFSSTSGRGSFSGFS